MVRENPISSPIIPQSENGEFNPDTAIVDEIEMKRTQQGQKSCDITMALSTIVFYALCRWMKNHFDRQKGLIDLELIRRQPDLVKHEHVNAEVSRDKTLRRC
jgi:hypothetical protein